MSKIGKNIKKIRNVRGLSQQSFADLFGLTRGNISSYEEFRAEPRIEVLLRIANYFSIPLSDFVEKELSVNELLHYNTHIVIEPERLKAGQQLTAIPYVPSIYLPDFIKHYAEEDFIRKLPVIVVPGNSRSGLIALEVENPENLPAGFDFHRGDLLICEKINRENAHRIAGKLGILIDSEGLRTGIYKPENGSYLLALNDWIRYPFDLESDACYWLLRAEYKQYFT